MRSDMRQTAALLLLEPTAARGSVFGVVALPESRNRWRRTLRTRTLVVTVLRSHSIVLFSHSNAVREASFLLIQGNSEWLWVNAAPDMIGPWNRKSQH